MNSAINLAITRGDAEAAYGAVRQAERRIAEMQRLSRDALINTNSARLLLLYKQGTAQTTKQLTDDWTARLSAALIP